MEDFEVHPIGTGEVLRQLRAEREALTLRVAELEAASNPEPHTPKRCVKCGDKLMSDMTDTCYGCNQQLAASKPEQQAQAGEPKVVAYLETITGRLCFPGDEHREKFPMCYEPLITLQSHREAIAQHRADLTHECDDRINLCNQKQAEVLQLEKRYMSLLESIANLKATHTPVIYIGADEGNYLKGTQ